MKHILLDLRGSVPVAGPQDFTIVREQVLKAHAQKVARDEDHQPPAERAACSPPSHD